MSHEDEIKDALRAHPLSEIVDQRAARDPQYAGLIGQSRIAMQPLLEDLAKIGLQVERLSDLRHQEKSW
jgi:hypothetical protein